MNRNAFGTSWVGLLAAGLLVLGLGGCGGEGGTTAAPPVDVPTPDGIATGTDGLRASSVLTITVTSVSIAGAPVVNFTVTNQDNQGMTGLTPADLRFNIAKLSPGSNGR